MFKKIIISIYFIVTILIFLSIIQIVQGNLPYIDQWTRDFVSTVAGTSTYTFFSVVTALGGRTVLIPFTVLLSITLWILYKNIFPMIFFGIGTLGGYLVNVAIKTLVRRERPSISIALHAEGYSFPSGHAMNAVVCFGILTYFLTKKMKSDSGKTYLWMLTIVTILLVGLSRYVINVHYLTDVVAGYYFGSLYIFVLLYVYQKVNDRQKRRRLRF